MQNTLNMALLVAALCTAPLISTPSTESSKSIVCRVPSVFLQNSNVTGEIKYACEMHCRIKPCTKNYEYT